MAYCLYCPWTGSIYNNGVTVRADKANSDLIGPPDWLVMQCPNCGGDMLYCKIRDLPDDAHIIDGKLTLAFPTPGARAQ